MTYSKIFSCLVLATTFAATAANIGYIYPAGAQRGTTVEFLLGGQGLWGTRGVYVTGNGIKVKSFKHMPGMPHPLGSQRRYLINWIYKILAGNPERPPLPPEEQTKEWRKHKTYDNLDKLSPLEFEQLLRFFFVPRNSLQMSPSISQMFIVQLEIDKNASLGRRELRLYSKGNWISNPIPFYINNVREIKEPRFQAPKKRGHKPKVEVKPISEFKVPSIINGQIFPGETDSFTFYAKAKEKITFSVKARELVPFLGDGVPGHFQAILEIFDDKNKCVALADDHFFNPDPILNFTAPKTGVYTLKIRDSLYRGREDFVYRIEAIPTKYKKYAPLTFTKYPELKHMKVANNKTNNFSFPFLATGLINKPKQTHTISFTATSDKKIVAETFARTLGSPIDTVITVRDSNGKVIAQNDDAPKNKIGTTLHASDSRLEFTPTKGKQYTITVADTTNLGSSNHHYYLRVDNLKPDFRIYTTKSAYSISAAVPTPITFFIERIDNFNEPIKLELQNKDNFYIHDIDTIPAGSKTTTISITANKVKENNPSEVKIVATAGKIKHQVIPTDEYMQAFAYTHLVPSASLLFIRNWAYWGGMSWAMVEPICNFSLGKDATLGVKMDNIPKNFAITEVAISNMPKDFKYKNYRLARKGFYLNFEVPKELKGPNNTYNMLVKITFTYEYFNRKTKQFSKGKSSTYLPVIQVTINNSK
jgi:hypothetical protein